MKLTPWIKCSEQQPTIPGWYDVRYAGERCCSGRRYWNGKQWNLGSSLISMKASFGNAAQINDAWRGLASDPASAGDVKGDARG